MIRRVTRLIAFELRKLLARRLPLAAFLGVVAIALASPWVGHVVDTASSLMRGQMHRSDPFENGWTALAGAVGSTRLFLIIVLLVLAGSAVAEEGQQGTLQALLVRPLRRVELLIAKAAAIWGYAVLLLLAAVSAAALGAELTQGLYDVVDPDYPDRLTHAFGDMWTYVFVATGLTLAPLAALTALGLLASTLFEHPGYATGIAIGGLFFLAALSGMSAEAERFLFVSYLGAPFEVVHDLAAQFTNTRARFAPERLLEALLIPALWSALLFGITVALLQRRDIAR